MAKVVSLFSGAGGLDLGFVQAGFDIVFAHDIMPDAVATYRANLGDHVVCEDVRLLHQQVQSYHGVDVVIGGPPCQGFSVAGKMDPADTRSQMVWEFAAMVEELRPKVFVMENVKALGTLSKWQAVRSELLSRFHQAGYAADFVVLNAAEYGVPQARERTIFMGVRGGTAPLGLEEICRKYQVLGPTVRQALAVLDRAGTGNNTSLCKAKVMLAKKPILRKSPYAGMLFNGLGRPVRLDGRCATLPASMGGNKTPIIDTDALYHGAESWVGTYHKELLSGKPPKTGTAPTRLRRLTVEESAVLQSFPVGYRFCGSQSSRYTQIGNAVPPLLAEAIAKVARFFSGRA